MILEKLEDHILTLTLNRPESSNAWTSEMIEDFIQKLYRADENNEVRVIIITGAGKHFCAGGDIYQMKNKEEMFQGESNELRERYHRGIQKIPRVFASLSTPSIAMVNGAAIGAGLDLACMCDIRIASPKAKFGETFVNLGLIAGDGGSYYLQKIVGFAKAMELSLTAKVIDSTEAKDIGLINYCGEDYEQYTQEMAKSIAAKPPVSVQLMKRAIENAYRDDLERHLNLLSAYQGITQRTNDHFQAIENLINKKSTDYKHK
tara:strand:+ start:7730 stop:8512 length:783 start_codon:yes stop_codon:yes gene_type:complete